MHPSIKTIAVTALSGAVLLGFTAPANARAQNLVGHWTLNEIGSATAFDSSGHGNHGNNQHIVGNGTGYTFNGNDSRVVVQSSPSLNPGARDFSFGATIEMSSPPQPVGETYDVLRKGLVTTKGGDYKFEVMNVGGKAVARCVSKTVKPSGVKVLAAIQGTTNLADGRAHDVTCIKTANSITLKVDGLKPRVKNFSSGLGGVSNSSSLAIGAKAGSSASTGFDWYEGVVDDAWVAIG
jgi:hypothetical protein